MDRDAAAIKKEKGKLRDGFSQPGSQVLLPVPRCLFLQWDDTFWDDSLPFVGNVGAVLGQRNVEASPTLLVGTTDDHWWEKW